MIPASISAGVGAVSVVLCDDPYITKLNASHRGKAAPTDVLSFELEDDLDFKVSCSRHALHFTFWPCSFPVRIAKWLRGCKTPQPQVPSRK